MLTSTDFDEPLEEERCHDCGEIVTVDEPAVYVLLEDRTLAPLCADCVGRRKRQAQTRLSGAVTKWD